MGNINFGRVLLGGLVAGLLLNIGEFALNAKVLESQMKEFMGKHGFVDPGTNFIAVAVGLTFVLGIVMVWTYALVRPRLGPGVKAAVVIALIAWFGIYFYCGIINGILFGIPMNTMILVLVWGLVEYLVAAIAGAWLYKEA